MPPLRIRSAWTGVALVFLFMLINFADKAVVGLSSAPIMRDLGLSRAQFGLLGSAFFVLFSISGVGVGFLANRVSSKAIMLVMSVVWSVTLLPVSTLSSFSVLLASRVILGAAEGPAFPVALHAVYKWFDNAHRALPTSIVASGAAFGAGIVAPLITWVIVHHGWHAAFGTLGAAGLVWACLWLALAKEGPIGAPPATGAGTSDPVPYRQLLFSRTALGVFLGGFGAYWVIALNLVWLNNYLLTALHMTPARAAWVIALPSAMQLILAPACAYLSQILTLRGYSSRISRGLLGALCVSLSGIAMACLPFAGTGALEVFLVGLSFSIGSVMFTLGSTLIGEISPAPQRGAMLGVTNSIHTLAGLCAPFVMGLIVDVGANPIAGFRAGYLYAGALVIVLGFLAAVLIDPQGDLARLRPRLILGQPVRTSRSAS
jgi:MFS transporter, ACS family, D-galactonate transporter